VAEAARRAGAAKRVVGANASPQRKEAATARQNHHPDTSSSVSSRKHEASQGRWCDVPRRVPTGTHTPSRRPRLSASSSPRATSATSAPQPDASARGHATRSEPLAQAPRPSRACRLHALRSPQRRGFLARQLGGRRFSDAPGKSCFSSLGARVWRAYAARSRTIARDVGTSQDVPSARSTRSSVGLVGRQRNRCQVSTRGCDLCCRGVSTIKQHLRLRAAKAKPSPSTLNSNLRVSSPHKTP
jgi:hypothetical protein